MDNELGRIWKEAAELRVQCNADTGIAVKYLQL
jgi:hypothetical protein